MVKKKLVRKVGHKSFGPILSFTKSMLFSFFSKNDFVKQKSMVQKYCQTPNLTSTQGWVWQYYDFAPPTPPLHKLNISNISAVTDPILMKL